MTTQRSIPVIGVVGGIGSGKSSVCRRVAERQPVLVIDGDQVGHDVLQHETVQDQLRAAFGDSVFAAGRVDRRALAARVFGDEPDAIQSRTALEGIVHPQIRNQISSRIAAAGRSGRYAAVLLDAAVLLEAGWNDLCDIVVYVDVPEALRRQRVVTGRDWSTDEFRRRQSSQLPADEKQRRSQYSIDNSGSLDNAARQLEQILAEVIS